MHKAFHFIPLTILAFAPGFAFAQSATITLSPDRTQAPINETVSVSLLLNSDTPVTSLRVEVRYDPSLLSVAAINTDESAFSYWWESTSDDSAGVVTLQASASAPGLVGQNLLVARISFQPKNPGEAAFSFGQSSVALTAEDQNILDLAQSQQGTVVIDESSGATIGIESPSPEGYAVTGSMLVVLFAILAIATVTGIFFWRMQARQQSK